MHKNTMSSTSKLQKILESLAGILPLGFFGAIFGYNIEGLGIIPGLLWGLGVGVVLVIVYGVGALVWRQVEKAFEKAKLWPYILAGLLVSLTISTFLALSIGEPTCLEYEQDNRGGACVEHANNGYKVTDAQRWNKFWNTLPVTMVITLLIATYVHKKSHKESDEANKLGREGTKS